MLVTKINVVFTGEAISCFQCSARDPGCDLLTVDNKTSKYYLPCPDDTYFCRKITQTSKWPFKLKKTMFHEFPLMFLI